MTSLREIYFCSICKNLVEIVNTGAGELTCCQQPMNLLKANSHEAATEKHIPVLEDNGDHVVVTVGSIPHPMTEEHYIVFIELLTYKKVYRKELKPGDKPSACFPVQKEDILEVREFCNLHMLWADGR